MCCYVIFKHPLLENIGILFNTLCFNSCNVFVYYLFIYLHSFLRFVAPFFDAVKAWKLKLYRLLEIINTLTAIQNKICHFEVKYI